MNRLWRAERTQYVSLPYVVVRPTAQWDRGFQVYRLGMNVGPGRNLGEYRSWQQAQQVIEIDAILEDGS